MLKMGIYHLKRAWYYTLVTPQYIISFLLYPIRRYIFSEKDSSPKRCLFLVQTTSEVTSGLANDPRGDWPRIIRQKAMDHRL